MVTMVLAVHSFHLFGQQWKLNSTAPNPIRQIQFVNGQTGFVCGDNNTFYYTTDGGGFWSASNPPLSGPGGPSVYSIYAVDELNVWVGGQRGSLSRSTDGGVNWNYIKGGQALNKIVRSIFMLDENYGFHANPDNMLFRTYDGFMNSEVIIGMGGGPESRNDIFFINSNVGWTVGNVGQVVKTTDGGDTFDLLDTGSNLDFFTVFFISEQTGWIGGANGTIYKTSDGGTSWQLQATPTSVDIYDIQFLNHNFGWAVGGQGVILVTGDGGQTWVTYLIVSGSPVVSSLSMLSRHEGWASCSNGDIYKYDVKPFITKWKTDNSGVSNDDQITIPTSGSGYMYDVYWEEESNPSNNGFIANNTGDLTITFPNQGTYLVEISGNFPRIYFNNGGDKDKLHSIEQWGNIAWSSMQYAFWGCSNLTYNATDAPNLSNVFSFWRAFRACPLFDGDLSNWDMSNATSLEEMFVGATSFNGNIDNWNVSNVQNMKDLFLNATSFDRDISAWNVGSVTIMNRMFSGASSFNQDISGWNVSNVQNMHWMFTNASSFNQNLGNWNVENVTDMSFIFAGTSLSDCNYDAILDGWSQQTVQNGVAFGGGSAKYQNQAARDVLTGTYGWTITDGGQGGLEVDGTAFGMDVMLDVMGGVAPYSFSWAGPSGFTSTNQNITGIDEGLYTVIVTDDVGCTTQAQFNLEELMEPFITRWKTDNPGMSADNQVDIPTTGVGYDYDIYWEEVGNPTNYGIIENITGAYLINFPYAGEYEIRIYRNFPRMYFFGAGKDNEKLISVEQWGDIEWDAFNHTFNGCSNMVYNATDIPNMTSVTSMIGMFRGCSLFNGDITLWDVSNITNMSSMFQGASIFNQDISSWNVSSVNNMHSMFRDALQFNQPIGNWNVSSANNMSIMFYGAASFNQDISSWNVSSVNTMWYMFRGATAFNQDIGSWIVSAVTNMEQMFFSASSFNQNLGAWNVSNVTNMTNMFSNSALSDCNYDAILEGWSQLTLQNGVAFHAGTAKYTNQAARDVLTGTYGWTITDGGQLTSISINESNPVSCAGANDGELTATAPGSPYTYQWLDASQNPISGETDLVMSNLSAGDYFFRIQANGCEFVEGAYVLTEPTGLSGATVDVTDELCFATVDGQIEINGLTGGVPPYEYSIDGEVSYHSANLFPGLSSGDYFIFVKDANNCSLDLGIHTVSSAPAIMISETVTNVSCNGTDDGSIEIIVTGGVPPYNFSWTGPNSYTSVTQNIFSLVSGTYNVEVVDMNGCQISTLFNVTEPALEDATFYYGTNPLATSSPVCFSETSFMPTITGTTGGIFEEEPFVTVLDLNPTTGEINPSNSASGGFVVKYTTPCGVSSVFDVFVNEDDTYFTYDLSGDVCLEPFVLSPAHKPEFGSGIYSSDPAGVVFADNTEGDIDLALSSPGTYEIIYTSDNCGDTSSEFITLVATPLVDTPADVEVCDSYTLPALTNGAYFTATNGGGTALTVGTDITTTQTIYVYAETGTTPNCTNEHAFTITINDTPLVDTPADVEVCDSYTLPALTNGAYFTATNGGGTALTVGTDITTTQTIYVYAETGTTPNCTNEHAFTITINDTPLVDTPADVEVCDSYTLPALTNGAYFAQTGGVDPIAVGADITSTQTIYVYAETGTTPNCTNEHAFTITINDTPLVDTPADVEVCDSYTLPALTNGAYFAQTGGLDPIAVGANITSTQTIYVYAETGTTPNCTNEHAFTITINDTPLVDTPADVEVCDSYTLPALTNGAYFTATNGGGTALTVGTDITSTQTIYVYAETGTTPNCTNEHAFTITINDTPLVDTPADVEVCDSYTLPALTNGAYYATTGGLDPIAVGANITATQTIYVYAETGTTPNCTNEHAFTITINDTPLVDTPADVEVCDSYTLPALTNGAYFTATNGGGTALTVGTDITSTQTIYVYAETGTTPNCTNEHAFTITINDTPLVDTPADVEVCDSYTLPALTNGAYFTATNGGGTALTVGANITTTQTIYVYAETGTTPNCTNEHAFTITINDTPLVDTPADVEVCDSYTLPALDQRSLLCNHRRTRPDRSGSEYHRYPDHLCLC
jgi:surface protein